MLFPLVLSQELKTVAVAPPAAFPFAAFEFKRS